MSHEISDVDSDASTIDPSELNDTDDVIGDKRINANGSSLGKTISASSHDTVILSSDNGSPRKRSSSPFEFKRSSSKLHDISDSESDDCATLNTNNNSRSEKPSTSSGYHHSPRRSSGSESDTGSKKRKSPEKSESNKGKRKVDKRPMCKYGSKCYRKNVSHLAEFQHPGDNAEDSERSESPSPPSKRQRVSSGSQKSIVEKLQDAEPVNLFLTTVTGISGKHNNFLSVGIKDILSPAMGQLEASCQFNYMTDIGWLVEQYPTQFRKKPLLIVHGEQRQSKAAMDMEASSYSQVKLCQAKLEIMYGTHHTKMMLLLYKEGMRVVIHTANLIEKDWYQKTQGVWISPLFPKSKSGSGGDSQTNFKHNLLKYIEAYKASPLRQWCEHIREHDMSTAKVFIIGSVPGRHTGDSKMSWGHMRLRKVLQTKGPTAEQVKHWPVIGQFSSIGSLGQSKENWMWTEWRQSLCCTKDSSIGLITNDDKLKLVFPSKDNVRLSLEGYPAGASIPYSINVAKKQPWLHNFFHQWKCDGRGRSKASPHVKSYVRVSPSNDSIAWGLITSANLSKAAWGALEKNGSQLMIRSYELGVLFIPKYFDKNTFKVLRSEEEYQPKKGYLPMPYDIPLTPYTGKDRPWIWDIPYKDLPDTNMNMWCPS